MLNSLQGVEPAAVVSDFSIGCVESLGSRITIVEDDVEPFPSFVERVRHGTLNHQLVFVPWLETSKLQSELLQSESTVKERLGAGFHRLVPLDVARGLRADGQFDLASFYKYVFFCFSDVFEIEPSHAYHEEDIAQILKDEPRSLICLLNVHLASELERKRLRCFTQEGHPGLVLFKRRSEQLESRSGGVLVAKNGPLAGTVYHLGKDITLIGRGAGCDVVTPDAGCSRRHAEIRIIEGCVHIFDLQSRNGTMVNRARIEAGVALRDGDTITLGEALLKYWNSEGWRSDTSSAIEDDFDDHGSVVMAAYDTVQEKALKFASLMSDSSRTLAETRPLEFCEFVLAELFRVFGQSSVGWVVLSKDAEGRVIACQLGSRSNASKLGFATPSLDKLAIENGQAIIAEFNEFFWTDLWPGAGKTAATYCGVCVPLHSINGMVVGALELNTLDVSRKYTEEDLTSLRDVATIMQAIVDYAVLLKVVLQVRD